MVQNKIAIPIQEIKSSKDGSHITQDILELDFESEFKRYDVMTEIQEHIGEKIDLANPDLRLKLEGILYEAFPNKYQENMNEKQLMDKLIEGVIEDKGIQPSYIMNHPSFMSPLAKMHHDNPLISERFELFANQMELGMFQIMFVKPLTL